MRSGRWSLPGRSRSPSRSSSGSRAGLPKMKMRGPSPRMTFRKQREPSARDCDLGLHLEELEALAGDRLFDGVAADIEGRRLVLADHADGVPRAQFRRQL